MYWCLGLFFFFLINLPMKVVEHLPYDDSVKRNASSFLKVIAIWTAAAFRLMVVLLILIIYHLNYLIMVQRWQLHKVPLNYQQRRVLACIEWICTSPDEMCTSMDVRH